ncbi:uncharacterized protein LOC131328986 [Rhododendron vialii]|uniref:uncharacterized protein LOC131328986 n=1 Tax=Rhododendron vialii TaxID=182163 RepID=UPI00265F765F|nr:uncharacterized protein LOC131328986 [Rhododendron vialii]
MASDRGETLAVKLDGKNYSIWRFHFQFFVEGKGLWGYVDGTEAIPNATDVKKTNEWKVNNAKVVSWILGSVDTNIGLPMRGLRTAKEMWDYLEKVYQQSNLARKFQIENDIFYYDHGEKSIQEYYAGFMDLWAEYEFVNLANMTNACCIQSLKNVYDERKVMQFLMKLRSDYENIRGNILNRGTLPTMDMVLGDVLREETRIATQATLEGKRTVESVFIAKQGYGKPLPKDFSKTQCFECKEFGHVVSHCKKKNTCVYCKETGHIVTDCPDLQQKGSKNFNRKKSNHRVYHAASVSLDGSGNDAKLTASSSSSSDTVGCQPTPISDDIRQLVQSSVSSAISSAFSAIGLSEPSHWDSEREGS